MDMYFESFDCQIQCEEVYWQDPCILTDEERAAEAVDDDKLDEWINSLPN